MNRYGLLRALYLSFYSRNFYRDVALNWGAKAFLYLLMLIALSWVLMTYKVQHTLNQAYAKDSEKIVSQIPVLTIQDGVLSTPEDRPYTIIDPESQETLAIIDTTGRYKSLEEANTNVLITKTEVISHSKPNQTRIDQFPKTLDLVVKPNVINDYIKYYLGYVWIFFFILLVFFGFCYRVIQALLYSLIGKVYSSIIGVKLSYGQIMQISMVAITPTIILATIFDFFGIHYTFQLFSYFILSMIYLFYGIHASKELV